MYWKNFQVFDFKVFDFKVFQNSEPKIILLFLGSENSLDSTPTLATPHDLSTPTAGKEVASSSWLLPSLPGSSAASTAVRGQHQRPAYPYRMFPNASSGGPSLQPLRPPPPPFNHNPFLAAMASNSAGMRGPLFQPRRTSPYGIL